MNFFLLLGQLGLTAEMQGEPLFPIGTLYDPFVCAASRGSSTRVYSGSRFVFAGTPSGISLSREGGAHQSTITPGIGMELPGLTYAEPCYARELEWLLLDGLGACRSPTARRSISGCRRSRSSRRRSPTVDARVAGRTRSAADVLAGGFRLREAGAEDGGGDRELRRARAGGAGRADQLAAEGVAAAIVVDVTSLDRLYRGWGATICGPRPRPPPIRSPGRRRSSSSVCSRWLSGGSPIVTVHDAASHAMAWLGSVFGAPVVPVGVDGSGQSGSIAELYGLFGLLPDQLVNAALVITG